MERAVEGWKDGAERVHLAQLLEKYPLKEGAMVECVPLRRKPRPMAAAISGMEQFAEEEVAS